MSKPGKVLKALCKKLEVRLTVKRGKKRVYKSVKILKKQCADKKKRNNKKKKVKRRRRRRFGTGSLKFIHPKIQNLYDNLEENKKRHFNVLYYLCMKIIKEKEFPDNCQLLDYIISQMESISVPLVPQQAYDISNNYCSLTFPSIDTRFNI